MGVQTKVHSRVTRGDQNAMRFNQTMIVSLAVLAFVLGTGNGGDWVVLALGISLAIGAVRPGKGPLQLIYRRVVLPTKVLQPKPAVENPTQHRFAQGMGAVCLTVSTVLLFAGFELAGWAVSWLVVGLALVNLLFGFCAGCFIFLQLERLRRWETALR